MKNTKVNRIPYNMIENGQFKIYRILYNIKIIFVLIVVYKCSGDGFAMAWRQVKPPEETFACNFDTGICKNWLQAGIGLLISR